MICTFRFPRAGSTGQGKGIHRISLRQETAADVRLVLDVMKVLAGSGMMMIVVTHEIAFAREVTYRVAVMNGGVIVESGPRGQVLTEPQHPGTRAFVARVL